MSKSRTADQSDATISQKIKALNAQMEQHAKTGEWKQVTEVMLARNKMLPAVPPEERPSTYRSAQQSTHRVIRLAQVAQSGVQEQISSLQRGREATASYRENS